MEIQEQPKIALNREEALIALFELIVEYREALQEILGVHSLVLEHISKKAPVEVQVILSQETNLLLKAFDKVRTLDSFRDSLRPEYLTITKPMKH